MLPAGATSDGVWKPVQVPWAACAALSLSGQQAFLVPCTSPPNTLRRVNSTEMMDALEQIGSPLGSGRASQQHAGSFKVPTQASPRGAGGAVELAAVLISGGKASSSPPPMLVAKKQTPATDAERALLLDRQADSSSGSAGATSVSKVHQRASATGVASAPGSASPLALHAAVRR